jgi:Protein of unknown function (DUF3223)
MPQFTVGRRTFRTKSDVQAELRRILYAVPVGEAVGEEDGSLIADLLHDGRHPETLEKIGVGIDHIEVRAANYSTRCFWIVRKDGTDSDFSIKAALNGEPSAKSRVAAALREEIHDEITLFRKEQSDMVNCAICGSSTSRDSAFVTYVGPSFDVLTTHFVERYGGWSAIAEEAAGPYGRRLVDLDVAAEWHKYHRESAELALAHPKCNLARPRR